MNKKAIFIFILVLVSLKVFDAVIANQGLLKNACYGYMLLTILLSLPYFFSYKGGFVLPVQLICLAIVISLFMAHYTWGQGIEYSATTIPYAMWFAFFYLLKLNPPIKTIENLVLIYGLIYIVLFLFQFTHTSTVYFGMHGEFKEERGVTRVNFPGGGVFFLSCFIAINRVTSAVRNRPLWLLYALTGLVIVVLQVTRQTILIMLVVYLVHFLKNVRLAYKIATISLFVLAGYGFLNSGTSISQGLADQQKEDASAGGKYIRILAAEYFLTEFTPNPVSRVLGNGFFNDTSNYGKTLIVLLDKYGYALSDVGLVEVYVVFGVIALWGYLLILIKSIRIPLPPAYYYLKYYLWMIMITSLTADFLISFNFLITTVLVLYCYQRLYELERLNKFVRFANLPLT
ncbi:hypothetical protein [Spirosoma jeollabukense]